MKKILFLCAVALVFQANCDAKDYAKMHMKQMKKNQEYRVENTYFAESSSAKKDLAVEIKDPKLIKLKGYEEIPAAKLKAKKEKDNLEYAKVSKFLASKKLNEYYMQAYGEDFYKVYRVTEKIIRANGLDFINWRLSVDSSNEFNAFNSETNCITVQAGLLDTFRDNDDALAQVIGHEIAHGLLGHSKRKAKYDAKVKRAYRIGSYAAYQIALKRAKKASRDMEYEADIEGAKLAARAGFDLTKGKEVVSMINTMYYADELNSTHPDTAKRIENFEQNRKYFMESEWKKQGEYNLYNSEVLVCEKSSNRNSIVITRGKRNNQDAYYRVETPYDMYLRYGYKSYLAGEFKDSIKYFKDYLKYDKGDFAVHLYISYAYENLYKQTNNEKYLDLAKEFAGFAKTIAPENNYVKEQILAL